MLIVVFILYIDKNNEGDIVGHTMKRKMVYGLSVTFLLNILMEVIILVKEIIETCIEKYKKKKEKKDKISKVAPKIFESEAESLDLIQNKSGMKQLF